MDVTVVTAALPSRMVMLSEACHSVTTQNLQPAAHLIGIDFVREGSAAIRNRLAFAASSEWLAFLDDDDLLYPNHLEEHAKVCDRADLVYSYCDVEGRDWTPNRPFDGDALRAGNFIPTTVTVRTSLFRHLGGFRPSAECPHGWEDWDLWLRLLNEGCRFACIQELTWRYRFHAGNKTIHGEATCF